MPSTSAGRIAARGTYVAPTDRLITLPFVVVTTSALAFFMYIGTLLPLIPLYIESDVIGSGEFGVGLNVAVFAVAAVLARPFLGRLANRYGRRVVIVGGALVATAGGVGLSQMTSLWPLLAFRAFTGIGEAAVFVGAATLIADLSPRSRRAEGASYFSVAVFTGLGLGPVLSEQLLNDTEFERTFLVGAGFALIAAAIALFAPARVVSPDEQTGRTKASPSVVRTGLSKYIHPAAVLPGAVLALGVGGLTTFFLFVPEYSRDLGMANSGGLFLVYAAISLVIRIFGATLPERLGPRRMVTIALVAFAIGLAAVAIFDAIWALWFAAAMIGLGAAFNYPSLNALTVNRVGDDERAAAISSFTMFFEIGSALSGLAVGALAQVVGKQHAFFGGVVIVLLGLYVLRAYVVPAGSSDAGPTISSRTTPQSERAGALAPVCGD